MLASHSTVDTLLLQPCAIYLIYFTGTNYRIANGVPWHIQIQSPGRTINENFIYEMKNFILAGQTTGTKPITRD